MNTVHPFMQQAYQVGVNDLLQLLDAAGIDPGVYSPFWGLKIGAPRPTPSKSTMERFVPSMIGTLCHPEARLRLTSVSAGISASVLDFFITGDTARSVDIEGGILRVSAGVRVTKLAEMIAKQLAVDRILAAKTQTYDEANIRLAAALWCGTGIELSHSIPETHALEILVRPSVLAHMGLQPSGAREALDYAIKSGDLKQNGGRIVLGSDFHCWMRLLWSGHFLEILYGYTCDAQRERPIRLMFAGPARSRFLMTSNARGGSPTGPNLGVKSSLEFRHFYLRDAAEFIQNLLAFGAVRLSSVREST